MGGGIGVLLRFFSDARQLGNLVEFSIRTGRCSRFRPCGVQLSMIAVLSFDRTRLGMKPRGTP